MSTKRSYVFHNFTKKNYTFPRKKLRDCFFFFVNIALHFYYSSVAAAIVSAIFKRPVLLFFVIVIRHHSTQPTLEACNLCSLGWLSNRVIMWTAVTCFGDIHISQHGRQLCFSYVINNFLCFCFCFFCFW